MSIFSGRSLSRFVVLLVAVLVSAGCADSTEPLALEPTTARANVTGLQTFYGPERFTRGTGKPVAVTRVISTEGFEAPFVLHVRNGDPTSGADRVSSGTVTLNGVTLLEPADFGQHADAWAIPVTPGPSAELAVTLASQPGSFIDVWLEGKRSAVLFCPDGRPGSIPNFQDAIDATPAGGTLLVCDGVHNISASTIDKPMTLRSQNPDGATLRDQDPPGGIQGSDAVLAINGIVSGTVRITDIAFIVTDGGIKPTGLFDQIEIDDVEFRGEALPPPTITVVAVRIEGSSIPTARVNVSNSRFSLLTLGVWPISATETNVRTSSFDRFAGGGVVFSNGNTPASQSFGRAEDNTFSNCGSGGCIRLLTTNSVVVARNTLSAGDQPVTLGAITVQTQGTLASKVIEDNTIVSRATGGAPTTAAGWMFAAGILAQQSTAGGTVIIRRNRITDAFIAVNAVADIDARDNIISGGFAALQATGPGDVLFQRNDVTGAIRSFGSLSAAGYRLQCNWWGTAAGPVSPPASTSPAQYTPFATTPIAGTSIPCDPGASLGIVNVCPSGGGTIVQTLAHALTIVAPNGVILMCDGTHSVEDVLVNKPVTIQSAGPGIATLDAGSAAQALRVADIPTFATTIIRKMRFVGSTDQNILLGNNSRTVNLRLNEFHPPETAPYGGPLGFRAGVRATGATQNLSVDNSAFIGGDIGVFNDGVAAGSFTFNRFDGQAHAAVLVQGAGLTPGFFTNSFTNCGPEACIRSSRPADITQNTFTIDIARPTATPIRVETTAMGLNVASNIIVGVGNSGTDRSHPSHYPISGSAVQVVAYQFVRLNRITNAYVGIAAGPLAGSINGFNNTIERTYAPFAAVGAPGVSALTINRSDLLDYVTTVANPGGFSALNLRCNYWGSAAGPSDTSPGFPGAYTPFLTQPFAIAGASCTP